MTGWRKRQILDMAEKSSPSKQDWWKDDDALEAFAALVREDTLAQPAPVQEPVAEFKKSDLVNYPLLTWKEDYVAKFGDKLYTTPPAQPAPVQKKSQQFTSEMNYSNNFKQSERNFCPRCGKRAGDYIHTCTPPQEQK